MAKTEVRASFGKLDFYQSGGGIPEGNYALTFETCMHKGEKSTREARLGVKIHFHPLEGGEKLEWFYSMGTKASKSWAPTQDGKGITPLVNGEGAPCPKNTNWDFFLNSMYNAGMPEEAFDNDLSTIDGVWVHIKPTKPPAERASFASGNQATSEAGGEPQRQNDLPIGIVSEILKDGAPWEGGGGIPDEKPAPKGKVATKAAPAKAAGKPNKAAQAEMGVEEAATNGIGSVLEKNPNGCSKLIVRTQAFKWVAENVGDDMAQQVQNEILMKDEALGTILETMGFALNGMKVEASS